MEKISSILNLELAWKRVKRDQYNDLIPDILELRDVDNDIKATIDNLRNQLDGGYQPSDVLRIDVPKKAYTLRPACNMLPEDRIIYQAVVDYISRKVEEPPRDACFSYRLNRKKPYGSDMFEFWRNSWLDMRRIMRDIHSKGDHCCLLRTDIAAYFEHIDHRILKTNILNGEVEHKQILALLSSLLWKWAASEAKHIGIPQGCDASSYIVLPEKLEASRA